MHVMTPLPVPGRPSEASQAVIFALRPLAGFGEIKWLIVDGWIFYP